MHRITQLFYYWLQVFWKYIHNIHIIEFRHNLLQMAHLNAGNNYKGY